MTQTGDPRENAVAERIHKTIKEEFTDDRQISFCNIAEGKTEIKKFSDFYNQQRPHRSVQWLTPNEAYRCTGALRRVWKLIGASTSRGRFWQRHKLKNDKKKVAR